MTLQPAPFIVGVDRSGTTLLRLMLDAHPDLAIPAETMFLEKVAAPPMAGASREQFFETVTGAMTWDNLGLTREAFRAALDEIEPFSLAEGTRCFFRLYAQQRGKARWGDKTPYYRTMMPRIQALLPEAHFIHLIRDGRDIALSLRPLWFGPGDDIEKQAQFWVRHITTARKAADALEHHLEIRYEALVSQPRKTLKRVCDFIGLPFDPAMMRYHRSADARLREFKTTYGPRDRTPGDMETFLTIHERVKSPPDPERIGRWRTEMSSEDRRRYEAVAGPLLAELGYETLP
jgi:sulfotransferase family protein